LPVLFYAIDISITHTHTHTHTQSQQQKQSQTIFSVIFSKRGKIILAILILTIGIYYTQFFNKEETMLEEIATRQRPPPHGSKQAYGIDSDT